MKRKRDFGKVDQLQHTAVLRRSGTEYRSLMGLREFVYISEREDEEEEEEEEKEIEKVMRQ